MHTAAYLLQTFLAILAAHGLSPEAMDPWRGWIAFKQFVREVDEVPDPGISVQLLDGIDVDSVRLVFVRQVLEPKGERAVTLARFVDRVEQHSGFADIMVRRPISSAVYWEQP